MYTMGGTKCPWWNRGEVDSDTYIEDYAAAFGIITDAVERRSDWARTYVSLDHHWASAFNDGRPLRCFGAKTFLERFASAMRRSGRSSWHVAFHPYPEDLFEPRFRRDRRAWFRVDTPKVTPRNIEVLTEFLSRPEFLLDGERRSVILSEQGFHTPNGPDGEMIQAAAFCAAYERFASTPGIDAFILHRHIDHPEEGGLRLGLLRVGKAGDRTAAADRRKPIYRCFRDADTPRRCETFSFARSWIDATPETDVDSPP